MISHSSQLLFCLLIGAAQLPGQDPVAGEDRQAKIYDLGDLVVPGLQAQMVPELGAGVSSVLAAAISELKGPATAK